MSRLYENYWNSVTPEDYPSEEFVESEFDALADAQQDQIPRNEYWSQKAKEHFDKLMEVGFLTKRQAE